MKTLGRAVAALASLAVGILAACNAGGTNGPDCDAIAAALVSRIEVRPATVTVNPGDSLQMQAVAFSCAGELDVGAFQWRSSDPTVTTVSASGLVQALQSGDVAIYAAAHGKEGSASVSTELARVARVTVEPASATVGVARTSRLTARAFDEHGRELIGRPATWSSANAAVVSVSAQGDITGVIAGGPIAVSATIGGIAGSSQITVVLVAVNSVSVSPTTPTIPAATTVQLTATLRDDLNNVLTGRAVNWTSSDPTIASINGATGLVTGRRPGVVTVTATSEGKSGTAQVTVTLGAPAKLQFVQQPSAVMADSIIAPAVTVEIQDAAGNRVITSTSAVTIALATPGSATLGGTLTVNAVDGVATFSNLTVSSPGASALKAASPGLAGVTSSSFVVTAPPATRLAFVQQPASAIAGASLGTVTVEMQDATGARATGDTAVITLAIGANPGGGTLTGTLTRTTANGVATFTGLRINRSGTGYTLTASATGLDGGTSNAFNITAGEASQVTFVVQPCPSPCIVLSALAPAPQVAVQDSFGNTVTGSTATVTMALLGGQGSPVLSGTTSVQAVAGVATFPDLMVSRTSTGLTLRATAPLLASDTSAAFSVQYAGPQLLFTAQPPPSVAAGAKLPEVRVQLQDAQGGNLAMAGVQVTMALGPSGTLYGTTTEATDANGLAVFNDLRVAATAGTGYTLTATAAGFLAGVSRAFAVTIGVSTQLTFVQQPPATVTVGVPLSPAVTVQLRDAGGNAVAHGGTSVSLAMSGDGALTNASATTNAAGLATFTGLTATATAGAGYTFTANSAGLASATSSAFDVVPDTPTQLGFLTQPGNGTRAGSAMTPAVQVEVRNANGSRVTTSTVTVTLTLGANPGGATLTGNVATASGGVASFPNLRVSRASTGYTLVATSPGLTSATSVTFRIR